MSRLAALIRRPWFWAYVAAALTFLPTAMLSKGVGGSWDLFGAALTFASFSVLVGLGQMLVITLGPGNVDLSIPATMTLAGTLSHAPCRSSSTVRGECARAWQCAEF